MKVVLENHTPLWVCSDAVRTCWASGDKSDSKRWDDAFSDQREWIDCGPKDKALIERVGNQNKHSSTLEHLYYNFHISEISRALLQELARHRIASLSVKSTRYTLKELKAEAHFDVTNQNDIVRAMKYLVFTDVGLVDSASVEALENLRFILAQGISNDKAKYCLPESYKTELAWSINARSLQNFLHLRTSPAALWEIRDLALAIYNALPEDHKYLFKDSIYLEQEVKE